MQRLLPASHVPIIAAACPASPRFKYRHARGLEDGLDPGLSCLHHGLVFLAPAGSLLEWLVEANVE